MTPLEKLNQRADELAEWLANEAPGIEEEQRHLDAGTEARAYWHYGYVMALRDVVKLLSI